MDVESIKKSILEDGFFVIKAPEFGRMADMFANMRYPFQTEAGLDLFSAILRDKLVRDTIESSFKRCGWGMFKALGPHPDTARALLNRTTDEMLALNVLLCRSGSRITLDKHSHMYELNAEPGGTGLLELPRGSLARPGITPVEVVVDEGGLVLADGRFFSTVLEGVAIAVAFAAEKELAEWAKMLLPDMPNLRQKVAEMETEKIKMNFNFVAVNRQE